MCLHNCTHTHTSAQTCNTATGVYKNTENDLVATQILAAEVAQIEKNEKGDNDSFLSIRETVALECYKEFNDRVFGGQLPENMVISWTARTDNAAGRYHWFFSDSNKTRPLATYRADRQYIDLSTKLITTRQRLRSTLLHEMAHAACDLIDKDFNQHNKDISEAIAVRDRVKTILDQIALEYKRIDPNGKGIKILDVTRTTDEKKDLYKSQEYVDLLGNYLDSLRTIEVGKTIPKLKKQGERKALDFLLNKSSLEKQYKTYQPERDGHGDLFHAWMKKCNDTYGAEFTTTIYHDFEIPRRQILYCDVCHIVIATKDRRSDLLGTCPYDYRGVHEAIGRKGKLSVLADAKHYDIDQNFGGFTSDQIKCIVHEKLWKDKDPKQCVAPQLVWWEPRRKSDDLAKREYDSDDEDDDGSDLKDFIVSRKRARHEEREIIEEEEEEWQDEDDVMEDEQQLDEDEEEEEEWQFSDDDEEEEQRPAKRRRVVYDDEDE